MILAVVHAHTTFWSGLDYLPDWTRQASIALEVPPLLFISGFLLAGGGGGAPVLGRAWRQIRKIATDYWTVAAVALSLAVAMRFAGHRDFLPGEFLRSLATGAVMVPRGRYWEAWNVLGGSLWFLRNYLACLPILVLALRFRPSISVPVALAGTIAALALLGTRLEPARDILTDSPRVACGFLLFSLSGAGFRIGLWDRWSGRRTGGALVAWAAVTGSLVAVGGFPVFAYSKFPPTWSYLAWHFLWVVGLCHLMTVERDRGLEWIPGPVRSVLSWCGRNIFAIYLVQGVTTSLPCRVSARLGHSVSPALLYAAILVWNFASTFAGTWLLLRFQERGGVSGAIRSLRGKPGT